MNASMTRKLLIVGAGKLGGMVLDNLALRFPQHQYYIVSKTPLKAQHRANLTLHLGTAWEQNLDIQASCIDISTSDNLAEAIHTFSPDVIFNATTMFPWWKLENLPPKQRVVAQDAGPGMWCALDCLPPLLISNAISLSSRAPIYVNGCYPDASNTFLADHPNGPKLGIGNIANVVPGLKLAFAREYNCHPSLIKIRIVGHHFTSLNATAAGSQLGAPYILEVQSERGTELFRQSDRPFQLIKAHATRPRGLDGLPVTASSASTVLAALLNQQMLNAHCPGTIGLPGGYPVTLDPMKGPVLNLPTSVTMADAVNTNCEAQRFDGIDYVKPGVLNPTEQAKSAFMQVVGFNLPTLTLDNIRDLTHETLRLLDYKYTLGLSTQ
jgi:hypothetical protein